MNHASLFSGIGGFDLAAQWAGWNNVLHCEINPFCRTVLKYYWPESITYEDITKTDFTIHRGSIDVLTGGFPCQPYSVAGLRKGKEDERHLWPEMLRAIREIQPKWIVGENVGGLINWNQGVVFEEVHTDLEAEGYEVQSFILPACAKDAPHRRDRVWIIAYSDSNTNRDFGKQDREADSLQNISGETICSRESFGTNSGNARYSNDTVEQGQHIEQKGQRKFNGPDSRNGINGWESFPTQSPICSGNDGISDKLAGITFSKHRIESIKGYGNAIVPQIAYEIFQTINEINDHI